MERNSREEKTRFKLKKAAPLEAILPLQRPLSEPVSFPQASQVDGLAVGQVLPGDINLRRKEKWNAWRLQRWGRERERAVWRLGNESRRRWRKGGDGLAHPFLRETGPRQNQICQSGRDGRPFVQLADHFIRPASWTDGRTWGEVRGDSRFGSWGAVVMIHYPSSRSARSSQWAKLRPPCEWVSDPYWSVGNGEQADRSEVDRCAEIESSRKQRGKVSDCGVGSDTVIEVETAMQNNLLGQCVHVWGYAGVHECRCDRPILCTVSQRIWRDRKHIINFSRRKKKSSFFTLHRSHISSSILVKKCCRLPPCNYSVECPLKHFGGLNNSPSFEPNEFS